ncbi:glycosyltransferase family 4 protein [Streptomyces sp. NPDC001817]|uniref:glycosyltransferase family 4 protein n=1 Tax=Streptomyces sp. NPDC001817 TaxID=3154398 RepID=UPI00332D0E12
MGVKEHTRMSHHQTPSHRKISAYRNIPGMILHISDCFAPRTGGIESQVIALAEAQYRSGQDVAVTTATPAVGHSQGSWPYPVHRITARIPYQLPVHPRAGRELDRLLTGLAPRVVHVHVGAVSLFAWSALACVRRLQIPAVVTVHSTWGSVVRTLYRCLGRPVYGLSAPVAVTAVSRSAAGLIGKALPHLTPLVVPNGIDPVLWRGPARNGRDDDRVHVVSVGRLVPRKQPMELLAALRSAQSRLATRNVALRATVAGDGQCMAAMRRYVHRHDMADWVRLAGRIDASEVRRLLSEADLFVNASNHEAFGIAALEARTSGVPVLARAHTGVADFVRHNCEGALCRPSTFALCDELVWLARTPGARRRMADHNRETPPTPCTWPVVTDTFAHCYDAVAR